MKRIGLMLNLAADEYAKDSLKKNNTEKNLVLECLNDNEDRFQLTKSIMELIETESHRQKVQRELEMLSAMQTYRRLPTETPVVYQKRCKECIARNIIK